MKSKVFLLGVLSFSLVNCSPWKDNLTANGGYETAIDNAITDYLNTSRLNKEFNTYHVIKISNQNTIGVSINGDTNKWQMGEMKVGDKNEYFPTKFKKVDDKLFYWSDSTVTINNDIIDVMKKYDILDTEKHPNYVIPDETGRYSEGAVHYYFCKTNYLKYKKVNSKVSIGYYKPPSLNCN